MNLLNKRVSRVINFVPTLITVTCKLKLVDWVRDWIKLLLALAKNNCSFGLLNFWNFRPRGFKYQEIIRSHDTQFLIDFKVLFITGAEHSARKWWGNTMYTLCTMKVLRIPFFYSSDCSLIQSKLKILFQTKRTRKSVNFGARKSFKITKWWESHCHFLVFYDFLL